MKPIIADTDDRRWQAVCDRDARADKHAEQLGHVGGHKEHDAAQNQIDDGGQRKAHFYLFGCAAERKIVVFLHEKDLLNH